MADFTGKVKKDYQVGYNIMHQPFAEFNDMSLIQRMDIDQKAFNSYVQPESSNPQENWRWNGVRPITRNRILSMAAHFVIRTLSPKTFAQNNQDEEDKQAAEIMSYLIEWSIKNSDYEMSYLFGILAALVNPVAYLEADYAEVMQTVKLKSLNGTITEREVVDDVLSGLHTNNVPADEVLISNAYEYYIQRQRFIIRKKFLDYDTLEGLYQDHDNFKFVRPGIKAFYSEEDGMFYDQMDTALQTLGEDVCYYNRREDLEVHFVNGIYFGDDDTLANPIRHRDNKGKPKYSLAKFGFEPIDEKRFYFYKSAAAKLGDDQDLVDRMWQMLMDGTFLEVMPPVAGIGTGQIQSNIMLPGATTNFPMGSDIKALLPKRDLMAGWAATKEIERSMSESSQDPQMAGREGAKPKTAYEVNRIEQNARVNLGIFGKMVAGVVEDYGKLLIDDILHYMTVGEAQETLGGATKQKFRTFLLSDQVEKGRKVTRKIQLDGSKIGKKMSKAQKLKEDYKVMEEQGGYNADTVLYKVNPHKFSQLNFMVHVDFEELMPKNEAWEEEMNIRRYRELIQNPFIELEALTRDLMVEPWAKGDTEKYMKKLNELGVGMGQQGMPGQIPEMMGQQQNQSQNALAGVMQEKSR